MKKLLLVLVACLLGCENRMAGSDRCVEEMKGMFPNQRFFVVETYGRSDSVVFGLPDAEKPGNLSFYSCDKAIPALHRIVITDVQPPLKPVKKEDTPEERLLKCESQLRAYRLCYGWENFIDDCGHWADSVVTWCEPGPNFVPEMCKPNDRRVYEDIKKNGDIQGRYFPRTVKP